MLERTNDNNQDFNRIVLDQVMVLRDLFPHAKALLDIDAWKLWGRLPGSRLMGAVVWSLAFRIAGEMIVQLVF